MPQYQGFKNYKTWNVCNNIRFNNKYDDLAEIARDYNHFISLIDSNETDEGVNWMDPELDFVKIEEVMKEVNAWVY